MSVHATLTGADLHESKGAAAASANTVAVSNGSGTTTWKLIGASSIDNTSLPHLTQVFFTGVITDVSTVGSKFLIPIPYNCTVNQINYTLGGAITVANASVVASNPGVGTMSTTTIPFSGSALGTTVIQSVSTNNIVLAGSYLNITSSGGSTTTQPLYLTVTVTLT